MFGDCVVPVRSVQLVSESLDASRAVMYANEQPVVFSESDVRRFRCIVNGSYPAPEVALYVGDDDVTDEFVADVELVRDGVSPYFRELYYRLQLTNDLFRIRHAATYMHICCSALYAIARPSVRLSVRPSVCPSVTRVDQSKTFELRITQPSPQSSSMTLVSSRLTSP